MKPFLTLLVIIFVGIGCEPAATFDEPQPTQTRSLSAFPEQLIGHYLSADHASTLAITRKMLSRTYDFDYKIVKDSLPQSYKLIGDTLIDTTDGSTEMVVVKGDTVIQHVHGTDTLFLISPDNVLKEFKGYYFLNKLYGEKQWTVQKLLLQKSSLTVGNISDKEDISRLKTIEKTPSDTRSRHFKLTRKQFKKFIKQHGFSEEETFIKVDRNTIQQFAEGVYL